MPHESMKELPRGIAVLTAWLEARPGVGPDELVWEVLHKTIEEGPQSYLDQSMGLTQLAGILLRELSNLSGQDPSMILQKIATNYGEAGGLDAAT
jgi:hypothetical protein